MTRPRLLDLFCGAGGAAAGYMAAGFEVVGIDLLWQRDYPGRMVTGDALTVDLSGFDAIHASPPCQAFTNMRDFGRRPARLFDPHVDLVDATRARLVAAGVPWIIENVPAAPLRDPITLCGSMFGLRVRRHRLFESNVMLMTPGPCRHSEQGPVVGVYGHSGSWTGSGGRRYPKAHGPDAAAALGITHTTRQTGLAQAVPPAYTRWLGEQLREYTAGVAAAR